VRLKLAISLLAMLVALAAFCWPLFYSGLANQATVTQTALVLVVPLVLLIVLTNLSSGLLDTRQIATLGVLIAADSAIRMLGAGLGGIETVFFLVILAGFYFGADFGFLVGAGTLLTSAFLTAGVGPWLAFQMLAAGLVGMGAGFLPEVPKRFHRWLLALYSIAGAYLYGALMTLWNWPFLASPGTTVSYVPGAGPFSNIGRFLNFELVTGGLLWDSGRAVTTATLLLLTTNALRVTFQRASRRARIEIRQA